MGRKRLNSKLKYPQPHSIYLDTGNSALNARTIDYLHAKAKHKAKLTQKQRRTEKRKETILNLVFEKKIYCIAHKIFLSPESVLEHKCYIRHGNPPVCKHLYYENSKKQLKRYQK